MTDLAKTAQYWNEHTSSFSSRNTGTTWWEAGTEIHKHINLKISGDPDTHWVAYAVDKYFGFRLPLERCLSLGCGAGALERDLAGLNTFKNCDAYDIAGGSISEAIRLARVERFDNIIYKVANVEELELPAGMYDAVWIHSSMHHFEKLEYVCGQIRQTLKPGGLLILQEYIGPNRFQFPVRQQEVANLCLQLLPERYRVVVQESASVELGRTPSRMGFRWFASRLIDKVSDGDLINAFRRRFHAYRAQAAGRALPKTVVTFPSARDVIAADPSEAVRSSEILAVLQKEFEIVEIKPWGGNILQFLLAGIAGNFSNETSEERRLLKMLIDIEDSLLEAGEFQSDFAFIVARPRTAS